MRCCTLGGCGGSACCCIGTVCSSRSRSCGPIAWCVRHTLRVLRAALVLRVLALCGTPRPPARTSGDVTGAVTLLLRLQLLVHAALDRHHRAARRPRLRVRAVCRRCVCIYVSARSCRRRTAPNVRADACSRAGVGRRRHHASPHRIKLCVRHGGPAVGGAADKGDGSRALPHALVGHLVRHQLALQGIKRAFATHAGASDADKRST